MSAGLSSDWIAVVIASAATVVYLALSALVGSRIAVGRMTADRILEDAGMRGGLKSGSRPRIALETTRHAAIAAVAIPLAAPLESAIPSGPVPALAAAATLIVVGRLVETLLAPLVAEATLRATLPVLFLADKALIPLTGPLSARLAALVAGTKRDQTETDDEEREELVEEQLEEFIRDSEREGLLEQEQSELLREVVDTGDMIVREVMTPRTEISAVPAEASIDEVVSQFVTSRHSRLPVFDGSLDRVIGVVALREMLPRIVGDDAEGTARDAMRPIKVVPSTKKGLELLRELQREQQQMAVVVDEFGGTAGLVTLEDLIEEIVGEIRDEHEEVVENWSPDGSGGYLVSGMMSLDDLVDLTGEEIDVDGVETVGGLVFSKLGRVPQVGDRVEIGSQLRFVVARMDGRRISVVQVTAMRHLHEQTDEPGFPGLKDVADGAGDRHEA